MRAVNLLPGDQRRGGRAGRSGPAVYVLLGALAAMVAAAGTYVLTANEVTANRAKLATAQQEATTLEQQAAAYRPYQQFASLSQARVQTVSALAQSRFDWERVMRELAQALPSDVWLTSLVGTVTPGVSLEGASSSGGTGSLRSALPIPAVELVGCTESQAAVSRVMARLRTLKGVERVSLAASEKSEAQTGAASTDGGSAGDCRNGSSHFPQFQLVVFFQPNKPVSVPAVPSTSTAAQTTPAAPGAATAPTGQAK
jgi:Tfp pilus assembly protein PilN